ncbi:hypothetical protein ACJ5H2_21530 [Nocardioides sp. R1-1]|uniref:hypothetical protein n=1 Tax=Nocardioides sp. R1-1 TaxID=3383502 RepID=UPI0038D02ED9
MLPARLPAVVVTLLLLTSACSGGGRPERSGQPTEPTSPVPALDVAWQSDETDTFHDADTRRGDALWTTSERVSVIGDDAVTTYDVTTGERLSRVPLRGRVCAAAPDVNGDGIGAVAVGRLDEDGVHVTACDRVVAVDTVAGTERWRTRVPEPAYLTTIGVGDRTVAVTDAAAGARRLRITDGRPMRTLGSGASVTDGTTVVAAASDERSLEAFDQDSGRLLRRIPVDDVYDVETVLSGTEPALVAVNGPDGFYFRELSRPSHVVGRELDGSYPRFGRAVTVGGSTVLQYGQGAVLDRWDAATRSLTKLTVLESGESLVGAHDGRLVTLTGEGNLLAPGAVVRAVDPDEPGDPRVLGTLRRSAGAALGVGGPVAVVADLLLAENDEGLAAYRLPAEGVRTSELIATAEGVLTPQQAADLCTGLRPATLVRMGYRRGAGAPVDCQYTAIRSATGGQALHLATGTFALQGADDLSPLDHAKATFANSVTSAAADDPANPLVPLAGLGDEAALGRRARLLLVREDNVVVHLRLTYGPRRVAARRALLEAVARDLLAELERRR